MHELMSVPCLLMLPRRDGRFGVGLNGENRGEEGIALADHRTSSCVASAAALLCGILYIESVLLRNVSGKGVL